MPAPEPQSRFLNPLERRAARRGRQEGMKEGRQEANRETLLRLLAARFGEVPSEAREAIAAAPQRALSGMIDRVLTAATLAEVLARA